MSGAYAKEDFKRECVPVRKLCGRCPAVNRMLVQKGRNIREIEDGKEDPVVNYILQCIYDHRIKDFLKKKFGDSASLEITGFWKTIEKEYHAIGEIDTSTAIQNKTVSKGWVINYSRNTYDVIRDTMNAVDKATYEVVSKWSKYSGYSWYGNLGISVFSKGIRNYFDFLSDINQECLKQVENNFENVGKIDSSKADKLASISAVIDRRLIKVKSIEDRLS